MTLLTGSTEHRGLVRGLAEFPPVTLDGQEYTGEYLSMLVALDPEDPIGEAARTPRLISELGRLVARAVRVKEEINLQYLAWRESWVFNVTNYVEEAQKFGFECACSPGTDAKGVAKAPTTPSTAVAEGLSRTLKEYQDWKSSMAAADEAHATLFGALEAAKSRESSLRVFATVGASYGTGRPVFATEMAPAGAASGTSDDGIRRYGEGEGTLREVEDRVAAMPRSPLPSRPGPLVPVAAVSPAVPHRAAPAGAASTPPPRATVPRSAPAPAGSPVTAAAVPPPAPAKPPAAVAAPTPAVSAAPAPGRSPAPPPPGGRPAVAPPASVVPGAPAVVAAPLAPPAPRAPAPPPPPSRVAPPPGGRPPGA